MASWMAWSTMASPIQLSLPALAFSSVYHFPLDILFLLHFIIAVFTGLPACIPYRPSTTWQPCTFEKE